MKKHERVAHDLFKELLKLRLPLELLDLIEAHPETDDAFSVWYVIVVTRNRTIHFIFRYADVTVQVHKLLNITEELEQWERQNDVKYGLDKITPAAIHMIKRLATKKKT